LRDYGTASWAGGDSDCDHLGPPKATQAGLNERWSGKPPVNEDKLGSLRVPFKDTCGKCGAVREDKSLGLEPTPEAFIASMVEVFREVKRVLREDGTLWLNMGDSYSPDHAQKRNAGWKGEGVSGNSGFHSGITGSRARDGRGTPPGLKPKDLVGMPWRLAFALQADGWYLRSDIIWSKPNPMPESVTDRPTKSHEYVFLLTKSARYFYDAEAVREPLSPTASYGGTYRDPQKNSIQIPGRQDEPPQTLARIGKTIEANPAGRNLRSVWQIATEPYPGAHFATFPQKLVEPCIKAGTSERGVCPECGAPWVREVEVAYEKGYRTGHLGRGRGDVNGQADMSGYPALDKHVTTTGWRPSCVAACNGGLLAGPIPATVLDPFAGSGTTGLVANRLGRRAILIDLSADYIDQAMLRNQQAPLGML
jgi:DNA modification methylase